MQNIQSMKQSVQKGFTLIELMIVVAIIGILAALAIPAYTDYTIKSRVAEGASLSGAAKTGIEVYWSENGTLLDGVGASITSIDIDFFGAQAVYVTSVEVIAGPIIEVKLRASTGKLGATAPAGASDGCFRYTPAREAGRNLVWSIDPCATKGVARKYLPKI
jgi:type IV pilus assembly protein PilA